ncbi:hypothetical protein CPHO_10535 [Corynebacterium phocae]|uniref:Uncharacterized protein n=1 Tax=Corynebacterium phocae TaxID=161895 RepID=A0A1L7D542_9CORY|nr:hypothetical protein [Corynebacterium phocae]APT93258.1 hypothetical protein CPHO_10535 [Corynebacterium phocae]KAA8721578.1 hypothetical protein F4V58_10015 [Corynebacterium phocae]
MASARFELSAATAKQLAEALAALPGVHSLFGGDHGEIALLFPGERVRGLRFLSPKDDTQIAAHIVVDFNASPDLKELAEKIRSTAFAQCRDLTRVNVVFADAA